MQLKSDRLSAKRMEDKEVFMGAIILGVARQKLNTESRTVVTGWVPGSMRRPETGRRFWKSRSQMHTNFDAHAVQNEIQSLRHENNERC